MSPIPHAIPLLPSTSDGGQSQQDDPLNISLGEGKILDNSYETDMKVLLDKAAKAKMEPSTQQWLSDQTKARLK